MSLNHALKKRATQRKGYNHVITEADMAGMWPQDKGWLEPPETEGQTRKS